MIATINPTTYLDGGALQFEVSPNSDIFTRTVRATRSPTLDGGAIINHMGYSSGDIRLAYVAVLSQECVDALLDLIANETAFTTSSVAGFYHGVIESIAEADDGYEIIFLVAE